MYSFNVQTACQAYAYSVLSGMRTLEQVKDNTNASDGTQPLTEEEKSALQYLPGSANPGFRMIATI